MSHVLLFSGVPNANKIMYTKESLKDVSKSVPVYLGPDFKFTQDMANYVGQATTEVDELGIRAVLKIAEDAPSAKILKTLMEAGTTVYSCAAGIGTIRPDRTIVDYSLKSIFLSDNHADEKAVPLTKDDFV